MACGEAALHTNKETNRPPSRWLSLPSMQERMCSHRYPGLPKSDVDAGNTNGFGIIHQTGLSSIAVIGQVPACLHTPDVLQPRVCIMTITVAIVSTCAALQKPGQDVSQGSTTSPLHNAA